MISPSHLARTTIGAMLADDSAGFNSTLQTLANEYRTTGFTIDYSDRSSNFWNGQFTARDLQATTTMKAPMQCLYAMRTVSTDREKGVLFSGIVQLGIDTVIDHKSSEAPHDTETLADVVEGALYNLFHSEANYPMYGYLTYTGDLNVTRLSMQMAGKNWRQIVSARMSVQLTIL